MRVQGADYDRWVLSRLSVLPATSAECAQAWGIGHRPAQQWLRRHARVINEGLPHRWAKREG